MNSTTSVAPQRDFGVIIKTKAKERRFVCQGLDPVWEKLPLHIRNEVENPGVMFKAKAFYDFCVAIVDETYDQVAAYKPNAAFFEALGWEGEKYLEELIQYIRAKAPDVAIIIDAKRGDIGNTNNGYVAKFFDRYQLDAITLTGFLGEESLRPFLERAGRGVIVLCKTSNEGSDEFQDRMIQLNDGEAEEFGLDPGTTHLPFYEFIAYRLRAWDSKATLCVVVGATYPEHLAKIREILPSSVILIPGVGTQGGDLAASVTNGVSDDVDGIIINAGSAVLYASDGPDFAQVARSVLIQMNSDVEERLPVAV